MVILFDLSEKCIGILCYPVSVDFCYFWVCLGIYTYLEFKFSLTVSYDVLILHKNQRTYFDRPPIEKSSS